MKVETLPDIIERQVKVEGITDIMFDRYAGDNQTQLEVGDKMYFNGTEENALCLPALNVHSFLCSKNSTSVAKLVGGKMWGSTADAMLSFIQIGPQYIPITRNGEPIIFNGFKDGVDEQAGIYVHKSVARLAKGIPNPKERPTVKLPWEMVFTITLIKNDTINETLLRTSFIKGGIALGFGTFRGVFGKFQVVAWD